MNRNIAFVCLIFLALSWHAQVAAQKKVISATFYASKFQNRKTASGEVYLQTGYTCAHKTLPFHTYLLVKSLDTGKEVIVKVNDRMGRRARASLDLSYAAAKDLGIIRHGFCKVEITVLDGKSLEAKRKELSEKNG